jgi:hypothetical protein
MTSGHHAVRSVRGAEETEIIYEPVWGILSYTFCKLQSN